MKIFDKEKVQKRLKELRDIKKWSQNDMAQKLNELIGYSSEQNVMNLDGETGKQTVSQLERGTRGLTIEIAFAYAEIFNISLDYIYGRSDDWQAANKSIKEVTGLSDKAIEKLTMYKQCKDYINLLDPLDTSNYKPNKERDELGQKLVIELNKQNTLNKAGIIKQTQCLDVLNLLLENEYEFPVILNITNHLLCSFICDPYRSHKNNVSAEIKEFKENYIKLYNEVTENYENISYAAMNNTFLVELQNILSKLKDFLSKEREKNKGGDSE